MPLTFSIVTQEREVLRRDDIERLIVPTTEGQITVLPSHAPLMASLAVGEMIARAPGEDMVLAIHGGFFQVANDETIVLADAAEKVDEIDEERADAARQRAEQRLAGTPTDGEAIDLLRAQLALQRALLRLRVRRRAGTGSGAPSVRA
ncbi:MAG TPA: ATP synthase F1 subunit epsilon [Dehalococcoidia bacterium]|nr:ATP synthase F1 subunit epsilon [Dehalococcoidia bacterium]